MLARRRSALMAPVSAIGGRSLGPRRGIRFGRDRLALFRFVTGLVSVAPARPPLRFGMCRMTRGAAAAPALAVACLEADLRDALDLDARDFLANQAGDGLDILAVMRRGQREGASLAAGASRAADAMHVVVGMHGHVEVEDMR